MVQLKIEMKNQMIDCHCNKQRSNNDDLNEEIVHFLYVNCFTIHIIFYPSLQ